MTTENIVLLPIAEIQIKERSRKDLGDIEGLALSISRKGQLLPIIVGVLDTPVEEKDEMGNVKQKKYILLAGERRIRALEALQIPTVKAILYSNLSEIEKKELELEENFRRKNFSWLEEVKAITELHELKVSLYGKSTLGRYGTGWSFRDTADQLGMALGKIHQDISLGQALRLHPDLAGELTKRDALRQLKRITENKPTKLRSQIERSKIEECFFPAEFSSRSTMIQTGSVDLILTDLSNEMGNIQTITQEFYRMMNNTAEGILFFSVHDWIVLSQVLKQFNFLFDKSPRLFQYKREDSFLNFIWFSKYMRQAPTELKTTYIGKEDVTRLTPQDKPINFISMLIGLCSKSGGFVFDPFGYGGVTARCCLTMQRNCIVFCNTPSIYQDALNCIQQ